MVVVGTTTSFCSLISLLLEDIPHVVAACGDYKEFDIKLSGYDMDS